MEFIQQRLEDKEITAGKINGIKDIEVLDKTIERYTEILIEAFEKAILKIGKNQKVKVVWWSEDLEE